MIQEATLQYLQTSLTDRGAEGALRRVHISVASSWVKLNSDQYDLPHVHPKVAFAGSLYLDCDICGIYLQDPRTPAGMAEVPEALRRKLGWGELQKVHVDVGSLVLYPAWLQHAPLGSGRRREERCISFTVAVQLKELREPPADEL